MKHSVYQSPASNNLRKIFRHNRYIIIYRVRFINFWSDENFYINGLVSLCIINHSVFAQTDSINIINVDKQRSRQKKVLYIGEKLFSQLSSAKAL